VLTRPRSVSDLARRHKAKAKAVVFAKRSSSKASSWCALLTGVGKPRWCRWIRRARYENAASR